MSVPMAWKPPSTWIISPVVIFDQSLNRKQTIWPTGVASDSDQPSGARFSQLPESWSKPGMFLPAMVRIGPAETVLTRMPCGPRSRAM